MEEDRKTIVLGASTNPERYSYLAVSRLLRKGIAVIPMGIKKGDIEGLKIENSKPFFENVHTITLYLSPKNQTGYYDYILSLHPERVIFNPGTFNQQFMKKLEEEGVSTIEACTLVMLSTGSF